MEDEYTRYELAVLAGQFFCLVQVSADEDDGVDGETMYGAALSPKDTLSMSQGNDP